MSLLSRYAVVGSILLAVLATQSAPGDDWPQWRGPSRDGVWRESGIVDKLPAEPAYRWRVPIGGGFAGPAVAGGRVFVADRIVGKSQAEPVNQWNVADPVEGGERVLCLEQQTGRILWQHQYPCRYQISYPSGPRATPTVSDGRVYTVGAMGDLRSLDAASGKLLWSKNYVRDFGTTINPWGMASAPLVDGDRVIVLAGGADGACVVALDKTSGREVWRSLDAEDPGYSSPILIESGGARQLIIWNSLGVYSLDPATGKVYWSHPYETKMAHSIATPAYDAERRLLFVSSFFQGPRMLQLAEDRPDAALLWQGYSESELPQNTDKIHCLMSTPAFFGDHLYGVDSYGMLRCLELAEGNRVWETLAATGEARWSNAFLIRHEDRFLLFNEHSELILARLTPGGYEEISRLKILDPTLEMRRRLVVWSHPAFADRCLFARNDREIVCVDLASPPRER
ncbi:MAG: PQQ-binding-like beta-propeller repeat protein [Planctomycetaceae bacterium]|nr:PQQ-binding-like beta-propeller repeat protein [Planctomycetaceae bacterium]